MRFRLSIGAALVALLGLGGFALATTTSASASAPLAAVAAVASSTSAPASTTAPALRGYCIKVGTGDFKNLWLDPVTGKCPIYSAKDAYWGPVSLGGGAGTPGPQGPKGDPGDSSVKYIAKTVDVAGSATATPQGVVVVQPKGSILLAVGVSPHGTTVGDATVSYGGSTLAGPRPVSALAVTTADVNHTFTVTNGTAADKVTVWIAVSLPPA